jgi:formylglycine-generating enzyme required for sulfatase activity
MHGNVQEWCLDFFGAYPPGDAVDPAGATSGNRVLRGGSWNQGGPVARSAARNSASGTATTAQSTWGLRVCAPVQ